MEGGTHGHRSRGQQPRFRAVKKKPHKTKRKQHRSKASRPSVMDPSQAQAVNARLDQLANALKSLSASEPAPAPVPVRPSAMTPRGPVSPFPLEASSAPRASPGPVAHSHSPQELVTPIMSRQPDLMASYANQPLGARRAQPPGERMEQPPGQGIAMSAGYMEVDPPRAHVSFPLPPQRMVEPDIDMKHTQAMLRNDDVDPDDQELTDHQRVIKQAIKENNKAKPNW